jgi:hypothetical protein
VSPHVESGNVYLPHPAIRCWAEAFIEEATAFPNGSHDDGLRATFGVPVSQILVEPFPIRATGRGAGTKCMCDQTAGFLDTGSGARPVFQGSVREKHSVTMLYRGHGLEVYTAGRDLVPLAVLLCVIGDGRAVHAPEPVRQAESWMPRLRSGQRGWMA